MSDLVDLLRKATSARAQAISVVQGLETLLPQAAPRPLSHSEQLALGADIQRIFADPEATDAQSRALEAVGHSGSGTVEVDLNVLSLERQRRLQDVVRCSVRKQPQRPWAASAAVDVTEQFNLAVAARDAATTLVSSLMRVQPAAERALSKGERTTIVANLKRLFQAGDTDASRLVCSLVRVQRTDATFDVAMRDVRPDIQRRIGKIASDHVKRHKFG